MLSEKDIRFSERWARKLLAWQLLGGKCLVCNNPDFIVGVFHHPDSADKEDNPSCLNDRKWEVYWKEISKCECMCANCHHEYHTNSQGVRQSKKK